MAKFKYKQLSNINLNKMKISKTLFKISIYGVGLLMFFMVFNVFLSEEKITNELGTSNKPIDYESTKKKSEVTQPTKIEEKSKQETETLSGKRKELSAKQLEFVNKCKSIDVDGYSRNYVFDSIKERFTDECLMELGSKFQNEILCKDIINNQRRSSCIALSKSDPFLCDSDNFCIHQFINLDYKVIEACNSLKDSNIVDEEVCSAIISNNPSKCPNGGPIWSRYYCNRFFALKLNSEEECSKIPNDWGHKDLCYKDLEYQTDERNYPYSEEFLRVYGEAFREENQELCEDMRNRLTSTGGLTDKVVLESILRCKKDLMLSKANNN